MVKHGFLHCHSMYSLFDSAVTPDELVKKAQSLGAKNITLTDHGTLLGIEPFMDAGEKYNMNTIPGCEFYLENREHFIVLAKTYAGYRAIFKVMRDAVYEERTKGKTYACIPYEVLKRLSGNSDIIATSACMQGPIASDLLTNYRIDRKVQKLQHRMDVLFDAYQSYEKAESLLNALSKQLQVLSNEAKEKTKLTNKSHKRKLQSMKKELDSGQVSMFYEQQKRQYEDELRFFEYCQTRLRAIGAEQTRIRSQQQQCRAVKKQTKSAHDRYITLSSQIASLTATKISEDVLYDRAKQTASYYQSIFPHFYIELQYHGIEEEAYLMPILSRIAKELSIPVIAGNDSHMADASEDSLLARQTVRYNYFERHQTLGPADAELYLKTDEELTESLRKVLDADIVREAMENLSILSSCHVVMPTDTHYPAVKDGASFDELLEKARKKRIAKGLWNDTYEKRLRHEIDVIKQMGFVDYHMVVRDFCFAARKLGGIPKSEIANCPSDLNKAIAWVEKNGYHTGVGVGPGRGSAGGSLVCYLLGITNIDPVRYHLLFERFLNPERVSMPDIDTDVKTSLRPLIIRYLKWRYGARAVCSIVTESTYQAKGAIKAAGRDRASELYSHITNKSAYKAQISDYMRKYVYPLSDMLSNTDKLADRSDISEKLIEQSEEAIVWKRAMLLEGKLYATGLHAGGVVISDNDDINEYIPLAWNEENHVWAAQCDMVKLEKRGLLKMDLLGLNNLDILSDCLQYIEQRTGKRIDLDTIPFEPEVFRSIYAAGKTNSIFQFESAGMKKMLKEFQPESIEDIILLVAAYRPGPMQFIPDIIKVKEGKKKPSYIVPELKDILDSTYGYPVYQEQLMSIFHVCAGFTLGKADIVRRYMSKKKVEKFLEFKPEFIEGLVKTGATKEGAEELWDSLTDFAKYAFNRSHAAAYSIVSYQTAWLKYHYPTEYLCAMFNNKEAKDFGVIIEDCRDLGIPIYPVDINLSQYDFQIENNGIRFGFKGIDGIGNRNFLKDSKRGYTSFLDFVQREMIVCNNDGTISQMKSSIMKALINTGAFDRLFANRKRLLEHYEDLSEKIKRAVDLKSLEAALTAYEMDDLLPADEAYNITKENELIGFLISINPLNGYLSEKAYGCIPYTDLTEGSVTIMGFVEEQKQRYSKKGNLMQVYYLQGYDGKMMALQMGNSLDWSYKVVKLTGEYKNGTLFIRNIKPLEKSQYQASYIINSKADNDRVKQIVSEDIGEKNCLLHIINYAGNRMVPKCGDLLVSKECFDLIRNE